ncbi:MAG: hypothetical protein IJ809_06945 [Clostridia bacterium]|nr:hypothetical protein [Clostridia bacterium]
MVIELNFGYLFIALILIIFFLIYNSILYRKNGIEKAEFKEIKKENKRAKINKIMRIIFIILTILLITFIIISIFYLFLFTGWAFLTLFGTADIDAGGNSAFIGDGTVSILSFSAILLNVWIHFFIAKLLISQITLMLRLRK